MAQRGLVSHSDYYMIEIDINGQTPLFEQLVQQVKQAVKTGLVAPGDALPSIRQLSAELEINAKTVAKAYKLLERDGVIEAKGYRGTHISSNAIDYCNFELKPILEAEIKACVTSLKQKGATDAELRNVFNQVMSNESS